MRIFSDESIVKKQALLFCAHAYSICAFREFKRIFRAAEPLGPCLVLWDRAGNARHRSQIARFPRYVFDLQSLSVLNIPFFRESGVTPGSTHFPLIQYALDHPCDHYWFIEYDVRFKGAWRLLFERIKNADDDFIATHVHRYSDESKSWHWWSALAHPTDTVPDRLKIRSFNPIFRISHQALMFIKSAHEQGWVGHQELLLATLLDRAGFKLRDFGGVGEFAAPPDRNRFYLNYRPDRKIMSGSTVRWDPPHYFVWHRPNNKLYHPVKMTLSWKMKEAVRKIKRRMRLKPYFYSTGAK